MRRWGIATACACVAVALVLVLFRAPVAPGGAATPPAIAPVLVRAAEGNDVAFDEQKTLADPTPLFLPTTWNAAPKGLPRPEPGARFENFGGRLRSGAGDGELKLSLPPPVSVPVTPADILLMEPPSSPLAGFGRAAVALPVLDSRRAFVEIIAEGTGRVVLRQGLADAKPPGDGVWEPMEFLVAVDAAGLVGGVAVKRRSGVEGVDNYFQGYLAQTLRVGQRLAPGFYRISVGP
ncbi:MAG TPA: hypothetical protein VHO24_06405 [Opitutaceae bacterium]|nr:hypothetical protein [Opitutaceae bacterium]